MTTLLESTDVRMTPRCASATLATNGAIAILPGEPRPILIGDLQWLEGDEILIFTAYGDAPSDAHHVCFDEALVHASGNITLMRAGQVAATFQRIEDADIEDPDDYRIAYQLWRDVAPLYQSRIERCYAALRSAVGL